MKNVIIDTMGEFAAQQVTGYQTALAGLVSDAMNPNAPTRREFAASVQRLQASCLSALARVFDTAVVEVSQSGIVNADPDAGLDVRTQIAADAQQGRNQALATVAQALSRDGDTALARVRDFGLKVQLLLGAGGRSYSSAVIAASIPERARGINFGQTDAAGRRWKTATFTAATLKGALQGIYADAFVRTAAARGASGVVVQYPDPEHEGHGRVVPFADSDETPGYLTVRNEIFHPNSRATLARQE
jgi:hypothetical protein